MRFLEDNVPYLPVYVDYLTVYNTKIRCNVASTVDRNNATFFKKKKEKVLEVGIEPTTVALLLKAFLKGLWHRNFGNRMLL